MAQEPTLAVILRSIDLDLRFAQDLAATEVEMGLACTQLAAAQAALSQAREEIARTAVAHHGGKES